MKKGKNLSYQSHIFSKSVVAKSGLLKICWCNCTQCTHTNQGPWSIILTYIYFWQLSTKKDFLDANGYILSSLDYRDNVHMRLIIRGQRLPNLNAYVIIVICNQLLFDSISGYVMKSLCHILLNLELFGLEISWKNK